MAAGKVSGNLENTWRLRTIKWVPNSCRLLGATESVKNMAFISLQITNLRFLQVLVQGNYPVKINNPYMPKESI